MDLAIKSKITSVLKKLNKILSSKKVISGDLKTLGNQLMDDVPFFKDKSSITLSVLIHSLYKVFSKQQDLDKKSLKVLITGAIDSIENQKEFEIVLQKISQEIKKYDKNLDMAVLQILKHAQVKKGLKIYEYGVSIAGASEIMGISRWEIMQYLGPSTIIDREPGEYIGSRKRLAFARRLFK